MNDKGYIEAAMALVCVTAVFVAVSIYFFVPMLIKSGHSVSDRAEIKREEGKIEARRIDSQDRQMAMIMEQNRMLVEKATEAQKIRVDNSGNVKELVAAIAPLLQANRQPQVVQAGSNSNAWPFLMLSVFAASGAAVAIAFILSRRGSGRASYAHGPVEHTVRLSLDRGDGMPVQSRSLVARNGNSVVMSEGDGGWKL